MMSRAKTLTAAITTTFLLAACSDAEETASEGSPETPPMVQEASAPNTPEVAAAQSPEDQIADAYLREMTKIADAFESVTDEASAEQAGQVIRSAKTTMDAMTEALEADLSGPKLVQILGPRQTEFLQVQTRLSVSMTQLGLNNPDLMQTLNAELEGMPGLGN